MEIAKERGIEKNKPAFQLCGGTTLFLNSRFALHLVDHLSHCWAPGVSHFLQDEVQATFLDLRMKLFLSFTFLAGWSYFFLEIPFCQFFTTALLHRCAQDFLFNIFSYILTFTTMVSIFEVALLIVFQVFFLAHFLFKLYIIAMFHHSILHHILWPAPLIPSFGALQILLRGMKLHPQILF